MHYYLTYVFCATILTYHAIDCEPNPNRTFILDPNGTQFLKDGKPFRYVAGNLDYFKVPAEQWRESMIKHKWAGLNAIQTYVEWSSHEPERGVFEFSGDNDVVRFLELAHELGLFIILRTGPYIDAERDLGGLPYWLFTKNFRMNLRTSDLTYLAEVDKWLARFLTMIKHLTYRNGGPILMVQIENEYGSFNACDFHYVAHLRDLHHQILGSDVQLFSTDGNGDDYLKCGKVDDVFSTIDFGHTGDAQKSFRIQRIHKKYGPLVNSEYYTGWIDHWEQPHTTATSADICKVLDLQLSLNASVTLYPLQGGTSFGFTAGGLMNVTHNRFDPCATSYDFDAPLTESGDPTEKYFEIRKVIGKYMPLPEGPPPEASPKMQTEPIVMNQVYNIYNVISTQTPVNSLYPKTFEELGLGYGFMLYSTTITFHPSDPAVLTVQGLADRAQVFINKKYLGTLSRTHNLYKIGLDIEIGAQLDLLVENQGRICYGMLIRDLKGITSNVTLGPHILKNWSHYLLFKNWTENINKVHEYSKMNDLATIIGLSDRIDRIPTFFASNFVLPNTTGLPFDSHLRLDGWRKGQAFLNGFNLGRYWTVGPQLTLYSPKHLFRPFPQTNRLVVFELEYNPNNRSVQFVKNHVLNATTPYSDVANTNHSIVQVFRT